MKRTKEKVGKMYKGMTAKISPKPIFLCIVFFTLGVALNAQTMFPNSEYWSLDAGFGMSNILVEGASFQFIIDPKLSVSHKTMVGARFGMNYSTDEILTFEAQAYVRRNIFRLGNPENTVNIFLQGGLGLLASYRGTTNPFNDVTRTRGSVLIDASTGVTIPLSTRWHLEPSIRVGYPHIYGFSLVAGYKFPIRRGSVEYRTEHTETIRSIPSTEIANRIVINAVEYILFAGDNHHFNEGIDHDAQGLNELVLMYVVRMMKENPDFHVRVEGHANPVTLRTGETEELLDLSEARAQEIARLLRERGVNEDQLIIAAHGGTRTVVNHGDVDHWNMNRRVELVIMQVDTD